MQRFIDIPTVDISPLFTDDLEAKKAVANQIHAACWNGPGFFHISNHGIDITKLQNTVYNFFKTLTETEKLNIAVNACNKNNLNPSNGFYTSMGGTKPDEKFVYANPNFVNTNPLEANNHCLEETNVWPVDKKYADFRDFCEKYYWGMFNLSSKLLQGFAIALGKDTNFFDQYFKAEDNTSSISLIKCSVMQSHPNVKKADDGTEVNFAEHQDVSLISIAFITPLPNVQVKINGEYFDVPVSDENFLVHCGSYMSYITHDYFPAMYHRAKFINAERLCLPFFVNLNPNTMIEPFFPNQIPQTSYRRPILYGDYWNDAVNALLAQM